MSRRRGEFEHRTSIFEGAFRAWSHLGGLSPDEVLSKPPSELDPLTHPIDNDIRVNNTKYVPNTKEGFTNADGTPRRKFPYEPLPRSGLAHPFVQAILSPWLGQDADNEAIQLGLTTLRTWWQHRRKGESGSAIAALATEKMRGVVEGYTRHFFTLAHCLVVNDGEQGPRTLFTKMKDMEKKNSKKTKKRIREELEDMVQGSINHAQFQDPNSELSPLEQLHRNQQAHLFDNPDPFYQTEIAPVHFDAAQPLIDLKGQCRPDKVNLPKVLDTITSASQQLAHRGVISAATVTSTSNSAPPNEDETEYGDPNMTPVVYVSRNGDTLIALTVDGITCAHCVKIVETVLKGCSGKSPIEGLLDAAADQSLASILIKIDYPGYAKRIAFEAARNLAMVGYTAECKEMSKTQSAAVLNAAFQATAANGPEYIFNWNIPCSCPDNGVLRQDCTRHSQMGNAIFNAFSVRQLEVESFLNSSGGQSLVGTMAAPMASVLPQPSVHLQSIQENASSGHQPVMMNEELDFFGMGPPSAVVMPGGGQARMPQQRRSAITEGGLGAMSQAAAAAAADEPISPVQEYNHRPSLRNPSIISYGNGLRGMSITSETTFGRAMSGLSALSIDWENLEDFDLEVDHSAHINNGNPGASSKDPNNGPRSSFRRIVNNDSETNHNVSFRL